MVSSFASLHLGRCRTGLSPVRLTEWFSGCRFEYPAGVPILGVWGESLCEALTSHHIRPRLRERGKSKRAPASSGSLESASMPAKDISDFQTRCLERLEAFLESEGRSVEFQLVYGREENYFRGELEIDDGKATLYVYEDEAGFYWDRRWIMKEWDAFANNEEGLIDALLADLKTFCFSEEG